MSPRKPSHAGPALEFLRLDHSDPNEAVVIAKLLTSAYAVEAKLLGVREFPPLQRTAGDVQRAGSSFYGCLARGTLVAVAELDNSGDGCTNIDSFVVHPRMFRRGIGSALLARLCTIPRPGRLRVSTAAKNFPALALYRKYAFREIRRWVAPGDIAMVTLAREIGIGKGPSS